MLLFSTALLLIGATAAVTRAAAAATSNACGSHLLFAFFKSDERLYYAASEDGLAWTELNAGAPVLSTTVSGTAIRDPFVGRLADGSFALVATNGAGFGNTPTILSWLSGDLVNFTTEVVVDVMSSAFFPDASVANTWAPEWVQERGAGGRTLVFWAARGTNLVPGAPACSGGAHRFVFFGAFTDASFASVEQPFVLFDAGCNVTVGDGGIDGDIVYNDAGAPTFAYKDARGPNESVRGVRLAASSTGLVQGPYLDASEGSLLATLVEGPELVFFAGRWLLYYDCRCGRDWLVAPSLSSQECFVMRGASSNILLLRASSNKRPPPLPPTASCPRPLATRALPTACPRLRACSLAPPGHLWRARAVTRTPPSPFPRVPRTAASCASPMQSTRASSRRSPQLPLLLLPPLRLPLVRPGSRIAS